MPKQPQTNAPIVAVIGTGPAGLMAASVLTEAGCRVHLFEKRRGPGRKLLIAGRSGLNITCDHPLSSFHEAYGGPADRLQNILKSFPPETWIRFVNDLGIPTFKGTSGRFFVQQMKASPLLRAWIDRLKKDGAEFHYQHECAGYRCDRGKVHLTFSNADPFVADGVVFALGGGSYVEESPLRFLQIFQNHGIRFHPFEASNAGFTVSWPEAFLKEAEGKPLKNVILTSSRGRRKGELVITRYGIEGTPVYHAGEVGLVHLDLKPDMSVEKLKARLLSAKENLSPFRRLQKQLKLGPGALALIFHLTSDEVKKDLPLLMERLKNFPLSLEGKRPLEEAISSSGGLSWEALNDDLMLKKSPGVFVAGEMIDWDAPTGGYLIQMCVSQAHRAAQGFLRAFSNPSS